uniref:Ubiquitin carboxyl-terminal hydrolase n=1 Tax=Kwoniella bestiolae CBS 10118 TaxID=1296100 RepID=A0A1B9G3M6_9TREE|nr:hypothetical protein I302_05431 [Kwoniella bestiolae CBS 10118]OCF25611.1 hypothetical protein I302_05431 [Kwoniella bestiolae CBS 10118]
MPPKKPAQDWSWINTISSPDQITSEHRRRAAGLEGLIPCPFNFDLVKPAPIELEEEDDEVVETDSKGKPKAKPSKNKVQGCTKQKCLRNPVCYNHLGAEQVVHPDALKHYLEDDAGIVPVDRDRPAGLRNLGATCYANAFLQLWYHNVAFRNGVYDCVTTESTPLYHLAMVFGMLQHSNRQVVDPMGLIEALRLEKGNQQDAAEFSKLFLSVLASEFAKHPNQKLQSFLKDQFEGVMEYSTACQCGHVSRNNSTFLELELSFRNNSTLEECLEDLQTPEKLEGDNLYNCPACLRRRGAIRRQVPVKYPPVLHIALMRFVFDFKTLDRKKSSASIKYPRFIALGNDEYELRAVITHEGKSAHHGHFICEVWDEAEQAWLLCNDEEVKNLSERPAKRPKLSLKLDGDTHSSKDAYMLVYRRKDQNQVVPKQPPSTVWDKVMAHNVTLREEQNEIGVKQAQMEDEFDHLNGLKKHTDHIVPRDSLIKWLEARHFAILHEPFDMSPITCSHGGIDPMKTDKCRLISEKAFDQIQLLNEVSALQICSVCVEERYSQEKAGSSRKEQVSTFDEVNEGDGEYVISKIWLDKWRAAEPTSGQSPTDIEYGLICEHGGRAVIPKNQLKSRTCLISAEALAILKSIVGDFPLIEVNQEECEECLSLGEANSEIRKQRSEETKLDRQIRRLVNKDKSPAYGLDYYALSTDFVRNWDRFLQGKGEKPELDMGLCEHGLLDYDPQMEKPDIMDGNGWKMLKSSYGEREPIVIQFGPQIQHGKKTYVSSSRPGVCLECSAIRRADFDIITIPIISVIASSSPSKSVTPAPPESSSGPRGNGKRTNGITTYGQRSMRSKSKTSSWTYEGTKNTIIKEIKVHIMNKMLGKLTPIQQKITYNGRELGSEETIGSIGFLRGDELELEEVVESDEIEEDEVMLVDEVEGGGTKRRRRNNEGFGGTALLARIACPDCTFENDGAAPSCEMCMRPFKVDEIL